MLLVLLFAWVGWHTMPGDAEVVTSFEVTCSKCFFRDTPPNIRFMSPSVARICQRFPNHRKATLGPHRDPYHYATLYDPTMRIPVYSAYTYKPDNEPAPSDWMVEPQLVKLSLLPDMASEQAVLKNVTLEELMESQAVMEDYKNLIGYDMGQLNPSCSKPNQAAKNATFTLTNIVPQYSPLKIGSWYLYECELLPKITQGCEETFAVVGAVPGSNHTTDGRVNIPSYLWSAVCCSTKNKDFSSWAMIARNNQNGVQLLHLGELEMTLAELYHQNDLSLFHSACPRK